MNYQELQERLSSFLSIDEEKIQKLEKYQSFLLENNKQFNLTSITEPNEMLIKHFYDSLAPLEYLSIENKSVLDFGSGAGFPGLPFAILVPSSKVTLLDATRKKCEFLKGVKELLSLENVQVVHARGEDFKEREHFDVVSARAVASLPVLLELVAPLLKVGGIFLAMKGANGEKELCESKKALKTLGLTLKKTEVYELPEEMGKRVNFLFEKEAPTPKKYPRPYADILKKPL